MIQNIRQIGRQTAWNDREIETRQTDRPTYTEREKKGQTNQQTNRQIRRLIERVKKKESSSNIQR